MKTKHSGADSKLLFPARGAGKVEAPGSSSWLVVEDENNGTVPAAGSVLGFGADSTLSSASSFESIKLDSSMMGSTSSLARSRSGIDGMSFCRLGASLLKQSIEKDTFTAAGTESPKKQSSMFGSSSLNLQSSVPSSPPFQKSEAYKHYQRSISSSESDDSETERRQQRRNERSRITDENDQLLQVKKESMELKTKLRKAELSIERLQENHRSLMPTISKLESDVAVAIASAAASSSEVSSFESSVGSAFENAQNMIHWLLQQLFRPEKGSITATELMQSSGALIELEAGTHSRTKLRPRVTPNGYVQAAVVLIIFIAVVATMCLVSDFEFLSLEFSDLFPHTDQDELHKSSPLYREDPL